MNGKTAFAGTLAVAIVAILMLAPVSVSDADTGMNVSFYTTGTGEYGVTVAQITSADELPEELQRYFGEDSIAVAFTLPSENPIDSSSSEVVDFLISYHSSSAVSVEAYAAAVDADGNTVLTLNERKNVISSDNVYLSQYMDATYSAYQAFSYTGGTAYAVVNVSDLGSYECDITLVTYRGNHANEVLASPTAVFSTIYGDTEDSTYDSSTGTYDTSATVSAGSDGVVVNNAVDGSVISVDASEGQTVTTSYAPITSVPGTAGEIIGSTGVAFQIDVTVNGASPSSRAVTLTIPVSFSGDIGIICFDDDGNIIPSGAVVERNGSNAVVTFSHFSNYVLYEDAGLTITASSGSHGSIDPAGTTSVASGGSVTYTFTADDGYQVDTVLIDGATVSVSGDSYIFSDVTASHTISVTFAAASSGGDEGGDEGGDVDDDGTDWVLIVAVIVVIIAIIAIVAYLLMRRN